MGCVQHTVCQPNSFFDERRGSGGGPLKPYAPRQPQRHRSRAAHARAAPDEARSLPAGSCSLCGLCSLSPGRQTRKTKLACRVVWCRRREVSGAPVPRRGGVRGGAAPSSVAAALRFRGATRATRGGVHAAYCWTDLFHALPPSLSVLGSWVTHTHTRPRPPTLCPINQPSLSRVTRLHRPRRQTSLHHSCCSRPNAPGLAHRICRN